MPLDYTLNEGAALVAPRDAALGRALSRARAGRGAWPILRQVADAAGTRGTPLTPTVLGVPSNALPLLHGWRGDFADRRRASSRVCCDRARASRWRARDPRTATRLALPVRVTGSAVQLVLVVQTPAGDAAQLSATGVAGAGRVLSVALPPALRGGRVIALQLQLPSADQRSAAHQGAEGRNAAIGLAGRLTLGPLSRSRRPAAVPRSRAGPATAACAWARAPASPDAALRDRRLGAGRCFAPSSRSTTAHCPSWQARTLLPAQVPTARSVLSFGGQVVHARLVATATRFPTTQDSGDSFVVADEASLASALGADDLPASIPDELWLSAPQHAAASVAAALRKPPFAALDVASRAAIHSDLQHDPIARGIVSSLVAAALAALALALLGVALATLGFLRDEGDSLFDLESQGAGPRALRACVRWRALGLALLGVLAGVALGIGLAVATGRLLAARCDARRTGSAAASHHAMAHHRRLRRRARAARRPCSWRRRCSSPTGAAQPGAE